LHYSLLGRKEDVNANKTRPYGANTTD